MAAKLLVVALLMVVPAPAWSEWQVKPFAGLTAGGSTTFLDLEQAAGSRKLAVGVDVLLVGDVFGLEADIGYTPGFFQAGDLEVPLVLRSGVTTVTGNLVVAAPRHWTEYTLRPYLVGGAGLMRVRIEDTASIFPVNSQLPAFDVGGGATGFLTRRVGLNWDVRYFRSVGETSLSEFGAPEQLSFWRANMALALRF